VPRVVVCGGWRLDVNLRHDERTLDEPMKRRTPSHPPTKASHARIAVKVQPGASADRIVGKTGEEWKITLTAPPVEGRANRACVELLASLLDVPRSTIRIMRGETSRRKLIEIEGVSQADVESKLDHAAR
jgi:uncharacterized protein (TIGR00251 family)